MKIRISYIDELFYLKYGDLARATPGSAAVDVRARIDAPLILYSNMSRLVLTGIAIDIKDENVAAVLLPRSGLAIKQGVILGNSVGLIDSDYQGEIMASLWNRKDDPVTIYPGDRIAQLMFIPVIIPEFEVVNDFIPTYRGTQGFGSTGVT